MVLQDLRRGELPQVSRTDAQGPFLMGLGLSYLTLELVHSHLVPTFLSIEKVEGRQTSGITQSDLTVHFRFSQAVGWNHG